jgi:hypothetical protein
MVADPTYQAKNYEAEGAASWVVGGTLEIASGGTLVVASGGSVSYGGASSTGATVAGKYTVTAADVTATHTAIPTGITTLSALIIQILRTGKITTTDAAPALVSGAIQVSSGSTYTLTAGDIVHWIAVGV